ncbi:hypothetical protein CL6EHI_091950 [Entamoeba histolytica]|uniref:Uncharacterized protein n=2 Tax=Entamoeba histolytica TaxID=5759 RepID=C4LUX2_ENTH1|nr:hypothetical protein EHI_091950 [Entamoeba histolytica HM-1:IMSS]EAL49189.1 hypothetical protein EHI_091950 [Entamoeba histolytica HM-1:IMSS]GAT92438.1 hypothetical protein CL6EHI_091950 [Entamoeba histolytica]|eukprot:XP_654573.1 hypothetical protein EHI_091950 [Entamoeba histolytica HM-1:IMSS]
MKTTKPLHICRVITIDGPSSPSFARNAFPCYSISQNSFIQPPQTAYLVLVEWDDLYIKQPTWVLHDELISIRGIDRRNLYNQFLREYTVNKFTYTPNLSSLLPAKELIPSKIIDSKKNEQQKEIFSVKWESQGNIYESQEQISFFEKEEYKHLLIQYQNSPFSPEPLKSCEINLFNQSDLKHKRIGEVCYKILDRLKTNSVIIENKSSTEPSLSYSIKFKLFKKLKKVMDLGFKGPFLIITNKENLGFYQENLYKTIPTALTTFITENRLNKEQKKVLERELYFSSSSSIRSNFVVLTNPNFLFRSGTSFDIIFVDTELLQFESIHTTISNNSYVFLYSKINSSLLRSFCKQQTNDKVIRFSFEQPEPVIKYVDCYIPLTQNQQNLLKELKKSLTIEPSKTSLICSEMIKTGISSSFYLNPKESSGKLLFVEKLINLFQLTEKKVVVIANSSWIFAHLLEKYQINIMSWDSSAQKNNAICTLLKCNSQEQANEIIQFYKEKNINLQSNYKVVCVDCNTNSSLIFFDFIDIVIDLRSDYSPLLETLNKNKFGFATTKSILYFRLIGKNSIDEITISMNETDTIFNQNELNKIYSKYLLGNINSYTTFINRIHSSDKDFINMINQFFSSSKLLQVLDINDDSIDFIDDVQRDKHIELNQRINPHYLMSSDYHKISIELKIPFGLNQPSNVQSFLSDSITLKGSSIKSILNKSKPSPPLKEQNVVNLSHKGLEEKSIKEIPSSSNQPLDKQSAILHEQTKQKIIPNNSFNSLSSKESEQNTKSQKQQLLTGLYKTVNDPQMSRVSVLPIPHESKISKEQNQFNPFKIPKAEVKTEPAISYPLKTNHKKQSIQYSQELSSKIYSIIKEKLIKFSSVPPITGNSLIEKESNSTPQKINNLQGVSTIQLPLQNSSKVPSLNSNINKYSLPSTNPNEITTEQQLNKTGNEKQSKIDKIIEQIKHGIKLFGTDVSKWNINFNIFEPLSSKMIQDIVNKIESIERLNITLTNDQMKVLSHIYNYVVIRKIMIPFPICSLKNWDCSCDITLLQLIIENGLNVPELYLNDLVIRSVLDLSGLLTEKQKCEFLHSRIESIYKCYSICQFN